MTKITFYSFTTWWCGIPHSITMPKHVFYNLSYLTTMGETIRKWHKQLKKWLEKWLQLNRNSHKIYLIISQYDDSYTTLDKMKHLSVGHYVRNDV